MYKTLHPVRPLPGLSGTRRDHEPRVCDIVLALTVVLLLAAVCLSFIAHLGPSPLH